MPLSPAGHLQLVEEEYAAAAAAPVSARKAMLVTVLLDALADRVFAAARHWPPERRFGADDILAFRAQIGVHSPAMRLIFSLCDERGDGTRLVTQAVEVPIADYPRLSVEDFMVSLYNRNRVQRVLLVAVDGTAQLAHPVLAEAIAWWRSQEL